MKLLNHSNKNIQHRKSPVLAIKLLCLSAILSSLNTASLAASPPLSPDKIISSPKLVVMFMVDQGRFDYTNDRIIEDTQYLRAGYGRQPGGIYEKFYNEGLVYDAAVQSHDGSITTPGHMTLFTGADPRDHKMSSIHWTRYNGGIPSQAIPIASGAGFNSDQVVNVENSSYGLYQPNGTAPSGANDDQVKGIERPDQTITSLTDSFIANGGKAFVIGSWAEPVTTVAGTQGKAIWYDTNTGGFISSDSYYPTAEGLPNWLTQYNSDFNVTDSLTKLLGKQDGDEIGAYWNWPLLNLDGGESYLNTGSPTQWATNDTHYIYEKDFPHKIYSMFLEGDTVIETDLNTAINYTPFINNIILDMASTLVEKEKLGQGDNPDLLVICLPALDILGHVYGPNSLEHEDTYYRIDLAMGNYISQIEDLSGVNADEILYVIGADHGMTSIPQLQNWAFNNEVIPGTEKEKFTQLLLDFYTPTKSVDLPNDVDFLRIDAVSRKVNNSINEYLGTSGEDYLALADFNDITGEVEHAGQAIRAPSIFLNVKKIADSLIEPYGDTPKKYVEIRGWFEKLLNKVVDDLRSWEGIYKGKPMSVLSAYHLYQLTDAGFYERDRYSQMMFRKPRFDMFLQHYSDPDDLEYPDHSGQILIVPQPHWYYYESESYAAMHGLNEWQDQYIQFMFASQPIKERGASYLRTPISGHRPDVKDLVPTIMKVMQFDDDTAPIFALDGEQYKGDFLDAVLNAYNISGQKSEPNLHTPLVNNGKCISADDRSTPRLVNLDQCGLAGAQWEIVAQKEIGQGIVQIRTNDDRCLVFVAGGLPIFQLKVESCAEHVDMTYFKVINTLDGSFNRDVDNGMEIYQFQTNFTSDLCIVNEGASVTIDPCNGSSDHWGLSGD